MVKAKSVGLVLGGVVIGAVGFLVVLAIDIRRSFGLPILPFREDENG